MAATGAGTSGPFGPGDCGLQSRAHYLQPRHAVGDRVATAKDRLFSTSTVSFPQRHARLHRHRSIRSTVPRIYRPATAAFPTIVRSCPSAPVMGMPAFRAAKDPPVERPTTLVTVCAVAVPYRTSSSFGMAFSSSLLESLKNEVSLESCRPRSSIGWVRSDAGRLTVSVPEGHPVIPEGGRLKARLDKFLEAADPHRPNLRVDVGFPDPDWGDENQDEMEISNSR